MRSYICSSTPTSLSAKHYVSDGEHQTKYLTTSITAVSRLAPPPPPPPPGNKIKMAPAVGGTDSESSPDMPCSLKLYSLVVVNMGRAPALAKRLERVGEAACHVLRIRAASCPRLSQYALRGIVVHVRRVPSQAPRLERVREAARHVFGVRAASCSHSRQYAP